MSAIVNKAERSIRRAVGSGAAFLFPQVWKRRSELKFWKGLWAEQGGRLENDLYESLFTDVFDLHRDDYNAKRVLDIGCGPAGSLEWADMTAQRVGLDPLVPSYLKLGGNNHRMEYVAAGSDDIPFPDEHFDIVTCLNALDAVDNLDGTIREIKRITKRGGIFLLLVEIDHPPTSIQPITVNDIALQKLGPEFEVVNQFRVGTPSDHNIHGEHGAVRTRLPVYVAGQPGVHVGRYLRK
jgi:SAM-dependent methyltransferase